MRRHSEQSAACYWVEFPFVIQRGCPPRCATAGLVERGSSAYRTRTELFGDRAERIETAVCQVYEESDCNLTKSDSRVEENLVTLDEEKGEITYVEEGHDVERVTAILRDRCRQGHGVSVVKLATETEESTSDVIGRLQIISSWTDIVPMCGLRWSSSQQHSQAVNAHGHAEVRLLKPGEAGKRTRTVYSR